MREKQKKNKGITLIALVITIVILLILAGLSISALTGSGLFQKAQDATRLSEIKEIEEVARLSYMERQLDEIAGGENATMAGVISDLKEKGYKIKQITEGANTITGIALSEESVTVERNTEKTVTYTLIYSEETMVKNFVEVQGKDYEILFNNGDITVNTEETNVGEINKEPNVTVTSSNSTIIEANKTEEGKIVLTAKNEIGDTTITIKEINSNITKSFTATTRIPATNLILKENATVKIGETLQLTATVEPSSTTDTINWTSADINIASITTDNTKNIATLTGLNGGTVTITVTCGTLSKTCIVKVERFNGLDTSNSDPEGTLPSGNVTVIESDASKGIVIKDKNNREWVWIQVPKTIFTTANVLGDEITQEELNAAIKADLISYVGVYRKGSASQNYSWDDTWYSGCGIADATTYNVMYNKMINSVYSNGGFWVQRREDGQYYITCGNAQKKASGFAPDNTKTSSLLFGIQWDLVCKYLEVSYDWSTPPSGKTVQYYINEDSSSWGRYLNSGSPAPGLERNNRMNIYDFAGNFWEWTLECAGGSKPCVYRGGRIGVYGNAEPCSVRFPHTTSGIYDNGTFRATFY